MSMIILMPCRPPRPGTLLLSANANANNTSANANANHTTGLTMNT